MTNSTYMDNTNKSKKISEIERITTVSSINRNKANTWIPSALYVESENSYKNVVLNLNAITNYCNSYSSYVLSYELSKLGTPGITYVTYNNNYDGGNNEEILAYCTTYSSYLIQSATEKISKNMIELINKIKNKNSNNSYIRNNSKKISELTPRDTITYHKDHSWFALAQYDSRVNAYVNIAMNLDTITSYCDTYSSYLVDNSYNALSYAINNLKEYTEGDVTNNIISYSFSYTKDYFEWQFL